MSSIPEFGELLAGAQRSAVHLETRDSYFTNPRLEAWQKGERIDWDDRASWWQPFHDQIADAVARGVRVRRARVVSEPVTEYIRWEHYVTHSNVAAGEQVRWLSRRDAGGVLLPANDFWIFDGKLMRVHHFSGDGDWLGKELREGAEVELYAAAFETIWDCATPHAEYEVK
ncbi:DUF6879 family protein [Streptomyces sp. NPDC087422]|uniref:DUF6879 family protein n=1 Tax=Streptomyces sp. NPDC087422 TaxID=3365786 RepID=UPI003830336C